MRQLHTFDAGSGSPLQRLDLSCKPQACCPEDNHPVAGRTDRSVDQGSVDQGTESQGSVARPGPSRLSAVPRLNESDDQAGVAVFRVLREMAAQSRMPSTGMSEREQEARIAELRSQAAAMNSR